MKHTKEVLPNDHHNNNRVFAVYATQSSVRKCDHMHLYETPPPKKKENTVGEKTPRYINKLSIMTVTYTHLFPSQE